ncbi:PP2C family protein-serine/threonine phosphatase [Rhodovulum kholense]|uniref:Serine/threonine protein phosphatase PrpC n=1 Tax=Rhodovulum kholense TaxID=453584 RepID=A0A8E3ASV3_9RHOB|nr:protein phosphatase 2C domain-containing protein [Rhodovulum kholense]PTW51471.1 serine/threonine protein phosphatase PrpC [Rhodovulum kholense]
MTAHADLKLDTASGIAQGRRAHQEDTIVSDFPIGGRVGLVVLADGMGGHAAGDVASQIAVTEVFSALKCGAGDPDRVLAHAPRLLRRAADTANTSIAVHVRRHAETRGMGTTLIAAIVAGDRLFWLSVGDSPLLLLRDGALQRINKDHSLAPQIDGMARIGLLTPEEARRHPDRNCLTSAICGTEITQIDCPEDPLELAEGDILVAASDGLAYIGLDRIRTILEENRTRSSTEIADALFRAIEDIADPEQDNVCFSVIRVLCAAGQPTVQAHPPLRLLDAPPKTGPRPDCPCATAPRSRFGALAARWLPGHRGELS